MSAVSHPYALTVDTFPLVEIQTAIHISEVPVWPLDVRFKRLSARATPPARATDGSACYDLYADEAGVIEPGIVRSVGTGWAAQLPPGTVMLVFGRSGLTAKSAVRLANGVGVVDSDYRGELRCLLTMDAPQDTEGSWFHVQPGMRIAQFTVLELPLLQLTEVEELDPTERGEGGFGSTGLTADGGTGVTSNS